MPARTTSTAALQPVAPLAIADYDSYIKPATRNARVANRPADLSAPSQSDKAKPTRHSAKLLEPISGVEPLQSFVKSPQAGQLVNIEFAPPAARRDDPFVSRLVKSKTVADPEVPPTTPDVADDSEHISEPVVQHNSLPGPELQPPTPQEDREPEIALAPKQPEQSHKAPTLEGQLQPAITGAIREPRLAQADKAVAPRHYTSTPTPSPGEATPPTSSCFRPAKPKSYCPFRYLLH